MTFQLAIPRTPAEESRFIWEDVLNVGPARVPVGSHCWTEQSQFRGFAHIDSVLANPENVVRCREKQGSVGEGLAISDHTSGSGLLIKAIAKAVRVFRGSKLPLRIFLTILCSTIITDTTCVVPWSDFFLRRSSIDYGCTMDAVIVVNASLPAAGRGPRLFHLYARGFEIRAVDLIKRILQKNAFDANRVCSHRSH